MDIWGYEGCGYPVDECMDMQGYGYPGLEKVWISGVSKGMDIRG